MITIHNLHKTLNKRKILDGIDFSIQENECIGLLGPNGAGKTTLIKCLMGILSYESGEIAFQDQPIERYKKQIGYLSQYTDFKSWMTCRESLLFFGKLSGIKKELLEKRISETLKEVGLQDKQDVPIEQLSGGMKQRLGVAQAILHEPQFLILDEPVASLDPIGRNEIRKLIGRLKQRMTILLSTHILHDVREICDRYIIMKDGRIIKHLYREEQTIDLQQVRLQFRNAVSVDQVLECFPSITVEKLPPVAFLITGTHAFDLKHVLTVCSLKQLDVTSVGFHEVELEDTFLELAADV